MGLRQEDPTVWVGYSDFLTTLVVLFFIVALVYAARTGGRQPAYLEGRVTDGRTGAPVADCPLVIGMGTETERRRLTGDRGSFLFRVGSIWRAVDMELSADCPDYPVEDTVLRAVPGDTTEIEVELVAPDDTAGDSDISIHRLPASLLFEPAEYRLKNAAAVDTLVKLGRRWKRELRRGEVLAIQGHTDDQKFQPGVPKTNWMLSGERAAEAAQLLKDSVDIPPCRLVVMGFGPHRPAAPLQPGDPPNVKSAKRDTNRRIEFRVLEGGDATGQELGPCP